MGSTGAVHSTVPHLAHAADAAAKKLYDSCERRQLVVWLDNWYRKRFTTDPRHQDMSLNVSVLAVLHTCRMAPWSGHARLLDLVNKLPEAVKRLSMVHAAIHDSVRLINGSNFTTADIRVPLDVHRKSIRSLKWSPYVLSELSVGSQKDLISIVLDLDFLRQHSGHVLPLLVDMDIHYRLLKLLYGQSLAHLQIATKLQHIPLFYGVCLWERVSVCIL